MMVVEAAVEKMSSFCSWWHANAMNPSLTACSYRNRFVHTRASRLCVLRICCWPYKGWNCAARGMRRKRGTLQRETEGEGE